MNTTATIYANDKKLMDIAFRTPEECFAFGEGWAKGRSLAVKDLLTGLGLPHVVATMPTIRVEITSTSK